MWEAGRSWPVMWRGVPSCRGGDQEGACCFLTLGGLYQWRVGCTHEGIESGLSGSGDRFCVWGGRGREGGTTGGCRWCVGRLGTGVWGGAAGGELPPRLPAGAFPLFYFFSLAWLLPRAPPPPSHHPHPPFPLPLSSLVCRIRRDWLVPGGKEVWTMGTAECALSRPLPPLSPPVPTSWPACSLPHCPIRRDTASTGAADQATGGGKGESRRGFLPPPSFAVPAAPTSAAVTASRPLRIVTPALKK